MPEIFVDESAGAIPASSQDQPLPAVPAVSGPEAAKDEDSATVAEPEKGGDGASEPARTALTGAFNEDGTENKDASAAVGGDVKPESPDGYELTFGESTRVDADLLG